MTILNNKTTGELWAELPSGGQVHLGTFHLDKGVFEEAGEDGIPGRSFDVYNMEGTVRIKGVMDVKREEFQTFRIRWLNAKFPSIDWYGGRRAIPGIPIP